MAGETELTLPTRPLGLLEQTPIIDHLFPFLFFFFSPLFIRYQLRTVIQQLSCSSLLAPTIWIFLLLLSLSFH